jgi:predicted nucleic acid-binding protein
LIDTSALIRFFSINDPQFAAVVSKVQSLLDGGDDICFTPQVARESWCVLTRPSEVHGFGQSPGGAQRIISEAARLFEYLPDNAEIYDRWLRLVSDLGISGRQVHDAYHVAAMMTHGITRIVSLDLRDFARYDGIEVVVPGLG